MEKDLCLDVALRAGKNSSSNGLPGADVVYTRSDDTFVPLEERTPCKPAKADCSFDSCELEQGSCGACIETYYLT